MSLGFLPSGCIALQMGNWSSESSFLSRVIRSSQGESRCQSLDSQAGATQFKWVVPSPVARLCAILSDQGPRIPIPRDSLSLKPGAQGAHRACRLSALKEPVPGFSSLSELLKALCFQFRIPQERRQRLLFPLKMNKEGWAWWCMTII